MNKCSMCNKKAKWINNSGLDLRCDDHVPKDPKIRELFWGKIKYGNKKYLKG